MNSALQQLFSMDIRMGIVFIVACVSVAYEGIKIISYFIDKFGITTKSRQNKENDHQLLQKLKESSEQQIAQLQQRDSEFEITLSSMNDTVSRLDTVLTKIDSVMENQNNATIENLYDCVNRKCKYYMYQLKGIPSDELESFIRLTDAYTKCGGNHGLQTKVDYCLKHLPVIEMKPTSVVANKEDEKSK